MRFANLKFTGNKERFSQKIHEEKFRIYADQQYAQNVAPVLRFILAALGIFFASELIWQERSTLYYLGFIPIFIMLSYGIFFRKLPERLQGEWARASTLPISSLSVIFWYFDNFTLLQKPGQVVAVSFLILLVGITTNLNVIPRLVSNIITSSIFLYPALLVSQAQESFGLIILSCFGTAFVQLLGQARQQSEREIFFLNSRMEEVVTDIIPYNTAQKLLSGSKKVLIEQVPNATVLFADIVGFTALTKTLTLNEFENLLGTLFTRFDMLCQLTGVEKIKTIGDAYMCASGVSSPTEDHLLRIADMALEMRESMARFRELTGEKLEIRIGFHTGPVIAGILGRSRFHFDVWGNAANTASRLEEHCEPGSILISDETAMTLQEKYHIVPYKMIHIQGLGIVKTYTILGPKLNSDDLTIVPRLPTNKSA